VRLLSQKIQSQNETREKLLKTLSYKTKFARIMLMKMTTGRNMKSCSSFINESLKASFLVEEVADQPRPDHSMVSLERPTEDWQQQVSGYGQDLKATSFFNVDRSLGVGPPPILDDTDASRLESMPPPTLEMTAEVNIDEFKRVLFL